MRITSSVRLSPRRPIPYRKILGAAFPCETWQDVLLTTLTQVIALLERDAFHGLSEALHRYISTNEAGMRTPRSLPNGYFYESHLNAEQIYRVCTLITQRAGLTSSDWVVTTSTDPAPNPGPE